MYRGQICNFDLKELFCFFQSKVQSAVETKRQCNLSIFFLGCWNRVLQNGMEKRGETKTRKLNHSKWEEKMEEGSGCFLVGGFNPFEKYSSKWVHLPQGSG